MISVITVTRDDAWKLSKTLRNVFLQEFDNYEHIVMDGMSSDGTIPLCKFWEEVNPRFRAIRQPDESLYDAMNQGVREARGDYVCFLNSGDIFTHEQVLSRVSEQLVAEESDGVIGWGTWRNEYWASWHINRSLLMSSNGFCHQALFLKRNCLLENPFTVLPGKTDSDTEQLANVSMLGAKVEIMPALLAERFPDAGISAWQNPHSTDCVAETIQDNYPDLTEKQVKQILEFRRACTGPELIALMMQDKTINWDARTDIACMTLDTLFLPRGRKINSFTANLLAARASQILLKDTSGSKILDAFIQNKNKLQSVASERITQSQEKEAKATSFISRFEEVLEKRSAELTASEPNTDLSTPVVALTSFPARIKTLHVVLQSLISQSVRPAKILVTLGLDEFFNPDWLPRQLKRMDGKDIEICWVESTRNQYDKFMDLPGDLLNSRDLIIVDDDLIYPSNTVEALVKGRSINPNCVVANRCHKMQYDNLGNLRSYEEWEKEVWQTQPSFDLFPTGAGGVLYPKGFFSSDVLDEQKIFGNAPYADDIWLKRCSLMKGLKTHVTDLIKDGRWYLEYIPNMLESSLYQSNVLKGLNDHQLRRLAVDVKTAKAQSQSDRARA